MWTRKSLNKMMGRTKSEERPSLAHRIRKSMSDEVERLVLPKRRGGSWIQRRCGHIRTIQFPLYFTCEFRTSMGDRRCGCHHHFGTDWQRVGWCCQMLASCVIILFRLSVDVHDRAYGLVYKAALAGQNGKQIAAKKISVENTEEAEAIKMEVLLFYFSPHKRHPTWSHHTLHLHDCRWTSIRWIYYVNVITNV